MSEEKEKNTRHSFTRGNIRHNIDKPKNAFGHTVLEESENKDPSDSVVIDSSCGIYATPKILNTADAVLQNMRQTMSQEQIDIILRNKAIEMKSDMSYIDTENIEIEDESSAAQQLVSEEENLGIVWKEPESCEETNQFLKTTSELSKYNKAIGPHFMKDRSQNECAECHIIMPEKAKFCPECGNSLQAKHCIECGYKFNGKEKFCPECGNSR